MSFWTGLLKFYVFISRMGMAVIFDCTGVLYGLNNNICVTFCQVPASQSHTFYSPVGFIKHQVYLSLRKFTRNEPKHTQQQPAEASRLLGIVLDVQVMLHTECVWTQRIKLIGYDFSSGKPPALRLLQFLYVVIDM